MRKFVLCLGALLVACPALGQSSSSSSATSSGGASTSSSSSGTSAGNRSDCKVVELKPGEKPPSGLSTSITAGGGTVSGTTTTPGGSSTSVQSGSGSVSASSSSDGRSTTVTDSNGNCTIYRTTEAGK